MDRPAFLSLAAVLRSFTPPVCVDLVDARLRNAETYLIAASRDRSGDKFGHPFVLGELVARISERAAWFAWCRACEDVCSAGVELDRRLIDALDALAASASESRRFAFSAELRGPVC